MSHTGPSGRSSLIDRYNLYNDRASSNSWLENIADAQQYWYNTPELLCLQWIIDDGVSSRGHRNNIFTSDALQVGIGIYPNSNETSQKADRVTMFHARNAPCSQCSSFPKEVNDNMCWSNFAAGQDSCDPDLVGNSTTTTSEPETKPTENTTTNPDTTTNTGTNTSTDSGDTTNTTPVTTSSSGSKRKCPNNCWSRGKCSRKGKCKCYKGFKGKDCSESTASDQTFSISCP
jgi:uncharacterized protein YkwD